MIFVQDSNFTLILVKGGECGEVGVCKRRRGAASQWHPNHLGGGGREGYQGLPSERSHPKSGDWKSSIAGNLYCYLSGPHQPPPDQSWLAFETYESKHGIEREELDDAQ